MTTSYHIVSSCSISNNTVTKNSHVLFTEPSLEMNDFFISVYRHFSIDYPRFYKMDHLCKLGWLASEIVLQNSFSNTGKPEDTGLVLSNANASLDTDIKYLETVKDIASPSVFVYTLPNIMIGEICIRNHFKGESAFFIQQKFDAVFMHQYVSMLFAKDILQSCICGWVELLDKEYKAVLFLVEKGTGEILFNAENINATFQTEKR